MKLQQLKSIWEVRKHNLNVSNTAQRLYTSQPGISRQIRQLEEELGVQIFARSGRHYTHVTEVGEIIIEQAGEILRRMDGIRQAADDFRNERAGNLRIATTLAACLPPATLQTFAARYPGVSLQIHQASFTDLADLAISGETDLILFTRDATAENEGGQEPDDLVMLPCYHWRLFAPATTVVGFRRGSYLRGYTYNFLELLAPHLTPSLISQAEAAGSRAAMDALLADINLPVIEGSPGESPGKSPEERDEEKQSSMNKKERKERKPRSKKGAGKPTKKSTQKAAKKETP